MRTIVLLSSLLLLATACGGDVPSGDAPAQALPADALSELQATVREASDGGAAGSGPSFADWGERLDELLTLELAAEATGRAAAEADTRYQPGGHTLVYRWKTDRQQEVMGLTVPAHDIATIGYLRTGVDEPFFRSRFAATTDEQKQQLEKEADRQVAERGMDAGSAQVAKELLGELSKVNPNEEIPGIGDVAIWEMGEREQVLHVLVNGSALQVRVDVGDPAANREASIALARRLVERL